MLPTVIVVGLTPFSVEGAAHGLALAAAAPDRTDPVAPLEPVAPLTVGPFAVVSPGTVSAVPSSPVSLLADARAPE
jgi:hypothetical protein